MNKLQIDYSLQGFGKAIVYVFAGIYTWIESHGIDAYAFYLLIGFMALDMILGWLKSSVVKELENPTSKKAKKGILTKCVMFVIPVVSGLIWGMFDKDNAIKVINVQLIALAIAEGYSNIANAYMIYTGEVLSEFDAVTFVIKKTAEKIRKLLDALYKDE